jgi:Cof subfamily protein (haloacid dehalogenase superfamily)
MPRMVVTDMDGTLLDASGMRVSPRNAEALRRAEEAGARVVIATGRPIWWLEPVLDMGFTGTAVCMNGAVVYDIAAGAIISGSPMTAQTMRDFVDGLAEHTTDFAIAVERLGVDLSSCWSEAAYDHPWDLGYFKVAERDEVLAEPAAKLLVRGWGESSRNLAATARAGRPQDVSITYSTDDGLLEVAAAGVNKGAALAWLADRWGITAADVVAFGDMPNDLEMLRWAGHPFAMANGHAEVHAAAAGQLAPHHDEDGVAQILERWF